ncbi:MAG: hypothetical protein M3R59_10935 [Verrucomicrobiota bacterium]|nr:hypothetical protein [Verrucomicrobiota bacterium]
MTLFAGNLLTRRDVYKLVTAVLLFLCGPIECQAQASHSADEKELLPTVKILGRLEWPCSAHRKKGERVFRTQAELMAAWEADGGAKESAPRMLPEETVQPPAGARAIDFSKEMVFAIFLGEATDHDGIKIERIVRDAGKIVVEYQQFPLYKGTAPMPASPCDMVVVEKIEGDVQFKELPHKPRLPLPVL